MAHSEDFLAPLNAEQRLAVEHGTGSQAQDGGPLLVIAGAGSGKTNTLAYRVAHLVLNGADPQRILLLTFSRRAAAEMERRAGQHLHRALGASTRHAPAALPWAGTFHGVGARLLREYAAAHRAAGVVHDPRSRRCRGPDRDRAARARARHHEAPVSDEGDLPRDLFARRQQRSGAGRGARARLSLVRRVGSRAEAALRRLRRARSRRRTCSTTTTCCCTGRTWSAEPALAREIGERFDHVLVDEYQDTNRLQASILLALKPDGRGVTVVGDDAQSIYSFRAATVRNILDFPRQFAPPARVVTLERNYRSTQPILDASNAVIGLARERFTKNLWTERVVVRAGRSSSTVRDEADQARCVAERVLAQREQGMALKSQAVLFRSSSHSAQLELELARRDIPFVKYGGLKFLEAAHVKDVLAVLRWADNPRNRMAGFRAARLLPGIGPATATRLLDALDATPRRDAGAGGVQGPAVGGGGLGARS